MEFPVLGLRLIEKIKVPVLGLRIDREAWVFTFSHSIYYQLPGQKLIFGCNGIAVDATERWN